MLLANITEMYEEFLSQKNEGKYKLHKLKGFSRHYHQVISTVCSLFIKTRHTRKSDQLQNTFRLN